MPLTELKFLQIVSCITAHVNLLDKTKNKCPLHDDYDRIRKNMVKVFSSNTIHDLVVKANGAGKVII